MIEESYVSFDTAKLLREVGFYEVCRCDYDGLNGFHWFRIRKSVPKGWLPCPSQALAARWLREVYHYAVCVWFSKDHEKWFYAHGNMDDIVFDTDYCISEYIYDSYEEALEAGLQEALKQLKSKDYEEDFIQ